MYDIRYSGAFRKDLKICEKRKYDFSMLQIVIDQLRIPESLPNKNRDHRLTGNYAGFRECHISPDWVLIYRYNGECLELARTGTHSDLFKK